MIGSEPLEDLCERLDKAYVAPALKKFFEESMAESSSTGDVADPATTGGSAKTMPCITVAKMKALIRKRAEASAIEYPLQST